MFQIAQAKRISGRAGRSLLAVLVILAAGAGPDILAEWIFDAEGGTVYEDNVNRAELGPDQESDLAFVGAASAGWPFHPTDSSTFTITGGLRSVFSTDFSDLTSHAPGVSFAYRKKFGLGGFAPFFAASARYELQIYGDDLRDGTYAEIDGLFGKRVSDRWGFKVNAGLSQRDADAAVFDQDAVFLGWHTDIALSGQVELYLDYRLRVGEVTSSSIPNRDVVLASKKIQRDEVFGDRVHAYLLDGTSHGLQVGVNIPLSDHGALDGAVEYVLTTVDPEEDVDDEPDYENARLRISYLHRF